MVICPKCKFTKSSGFTLCPICNPMSDIGYIESMSYMNLNNNADFDKNEHHKIINKCGDPENYEGCFLADYKVAYELIQKHDFDEANRKYIELAKKGDVNSQYNVAMLTYDLNYTATEHWLRMAYNNGSEKATYALGKYYLSSKKYEKAYALLSEAEKYGGVNILIDLSFMYANGYGVKEDESKAIMLLVKATKEYPDNSEARANLSCFYLENGYFDKAKENADKAFDLGFDNPTFFTSQYERMVWARENGQISANAAKRYTQFYKEYALRLDDHGVQKVDSELFADAEKKRSLEEKRSPMVSISGIIGVIFISIILMFYFNLYSLILQPINWQSFKDSPFFTISVLLALYVLWKFFSSLR